MMVEGDKDVRWDVTGIIPKLQELSPRTLKVLAIEGLATEICQMGMIMVVDNLVGNRGVIVLGSMENNKENTKTCAHSRGL